MNRRFFAVSMVVLTTALLSAPNFVGTATALPLSDVADLTTVINDTGGHAASDNQAEATNRNVEANPADVKSMDAILAALYDVISGPAGKARDWNRFRSLFVPGARLIPASRRPDGSFEARVLSPEDYVARASPAFEKAGFFEKGVANKVETFGQVTHVFSTYESRHNASDKTPFARGINSIQLLNDGKRWWVVTVYWDSERPGNQIPTQYLPQNK